MVVSNSSSASWELHSRPRERGWNVGDRENSSHWHLLGREISVACALSHYLLSSWRLLLCICILQTGKLRRREVKKLASSSPNLIPKSMFLLTMNALQFLLKENEIKVWPESLAGLEQCVCLGMRISHSREMAWAKAQRGKNRGYVEKVKYECVFNNKSGWMSFELQN